ncbi:hypothetical protein JOC86_003299 [Bacillus pakistanensis]|uniref:Uncharacterized protein n=1 Tax=Rossellomorea pakistanensis TaxID=992288 RepID=A0ABS2NFX3_9BACI|nr:hypothetical protein [Bacillus pakistanensis]
MEKKRKKYEKLKGNHLLTTNISNRYIQFSINLFVVLRNTDFEGGAIE